MAENPENPELEDDLDAEEAQELRDKIWVFTQRIAVALVIFVAGILVGLIKPGTVAPMFRPLGIKGPAGALEDKVDQLSERNTSLVKERDTLKSKVALLDRDLKENEKKIQEALAKAAACEAAGPAEMP